MVDRIRASPVVHADETGCRLRVDFSTPTERYFLRRGRGKAVVDEALGESFSGVRTLLSARRSCCGNDGMDTAVGVFAQLAWERQCGHPRSAWLTRGCPGQAVPGMSFQPDVFVITQYLSTYVNVLAMLMFWLDFNPSPARRGEGQSPAARPDAVGHPGLAAGRARGRGGVAVMERGAVLRQRAGALFP